MFYKIRVDEVKDELNNTHIVYGIDVYQCVHSVPDVFTDEQCAKQFIQRCNDFDLDPIHLNDVIENCLAEI